jgi:cytochrome c-type biogenesis protein CcmH
MSERVRSWTALAVIALSLGVVIAVLSSNAPTDANRVEDLAIRLKCPVCESESIADSPSQVARDSYDLIAERVAEGWTDDEIVAFFVATYGNAVLLDPPARGATVILWIAPIAALAIGGVILSGRLARTRRDITDEERRRIAAELESRR